MKSDAQLMAEVATWIQSKQRAREEFERLDAAYTTARDAHREAAKAAFRLGLTGAKLGDEVAAASAQENRLRARAVELGTQRIHAVSTLDVCEAGYLATYNELYARNVKVP